MVITTLIALALMMGAAAYLSARRRRIRLDERLHYIDRVTFGPSVEKRLGEIYPQLDEWQRQQIQDGLRDYFKICARAGKRLVSMPSRAVDEAWHALILDTRRYQEICRLAVGRFLHHVPAEAMSSPVHAQIGIRRAWKLACRLEDISAGRPSRLPRLFALDAQLGITGGFIYALDCLDSRWGSDHYCASHIGCSSGSCAADGGGDGGCGGGCGGD